ncbi:TPA: hypothetical protein N0F65_007147 [Lagenidium giganteum]|uniref:Uncharacterized protein n=1 Tax=Lagenidium giganteum TaxID=4803 RepID=A0AAV2YW24_9STRA|nr:TPA: hypothetical protein N0F65_007147 [Lagenidium giganteum]
MSAHDDWTPIGAIPIASKHLPHIDHHRDGDPALSPSKLLMRWFRSFHAWKSQHLFIGRYSVDKLLLLDGYTRSASWLRIVAVVVLTLVPVLVVVALLHVVPLNDPASGLGSNLTALVRSALADIVLTFMFLIAMKQGTGAGNDVYPLRTLLMIAGLTGTCNEAVWTGVAFAWKFPVPYRELAGALTWVAFCALSHWLLGRRALMKWRKAFVRYLSIASAQFLFFFILLALIRVFGMLGETYQFLMVLVFPVLKTILKRRLWREARKLRDLTTDVTVCMIEISSALYQTACIQNAQSTIVTTAVMVADIVQAIIEVRLYVNHPYIVDGRSVVETAVMIVESGLFPDVDEHSDAARELRWYRARQIGQHFPSQKSSRSSSIEITKTKKRISMTPDARCMLLKGKEYVSHGEKKLMRLLPSDLKRPRNGPSATNESPAVSPGDRSIPAIILDGIKIPRRDLARILEQTLQLLFSCEVLVFIEFIEVFIPVTYGAQHNTVLLSKSPAHVGEMIAMSLMYAAMESVSLVAMAWIMNKKYGINVVKQLAFILETYAMTLHGKIVGTFITVIGLTSVHQGARVMCHLSTAATLTNVL